MTTNEALEVLKETGMYLNRHVGTDSYNQRCRIHDAYHVLKLAYTPTNQQRVTDGEIRELIINSGEGTWRIGDTDLEYVDCVEITGLVRDIQDRLSQLPEGEGKKEDECLITGCNNKKHDIHSRCIDHLST